MEKLLKTKDVAELLQEKVSTVHRMRQAGEGPPYIKLRDNPRAAVRYRRRDVESWLETRMQTRTQ
jgi:predicted DNA-binding transcriptional regulator AlpA